MADHQFIIPGVGCFDIYGAGPGLVIETSRGPVWFTWSERFGPLPVTKDGRERSLAPRHPFWTVASWWNIQGQRTDGSRAIWHQPRPDVYERRGRHLFVVEAGETGWDWGDPPGRPIIRAALTEGEGAGKP